MNVDKYLVLETSNPRPCHHEFVKVTQTTFEPSDELHNMYVNKCYYSFAFVDALVQNTFLITPIPPSPSTSQWKLYKILYIICYTICGVISHMQSSDHDYSKVQRNFSLRYTPSSSTNRGLYQQNVSTECFINSIASK